MHRQAWNKWLPSKSLLLLVINIMTVMKRTHAAVNILATSIWKCRWKFSWLCAGSGPGFIFIDHEQDVVSPPCSTRRTPFLPASLDLCFSPAPSLSVTLPLLLVLHKLWPPLGQGSWYSLWGPVLCTWKWKSLNRVLLFATPWTIRDIILEWVAVLFSREASHPRDQTQVSCTAGGFFTNWATREAQYSAQYIAVKEMLVQLTCIPSCCFSTSKLRLWLARRGVGLTWVLFFNETLHWTFFSEVWLMGLDRC